MPAVESWDDDGDFQGDLFANSTFGAAHNVAPNPISSKVSVRSESNVGEEDWQMLIAPNDPKSKISAISSANQVGIPIPQNVPSTALLGGSIKRLGKKKSKKDVSDDWGDDFDMPDAQPPPLKLRQMNPDPGAKTPALDQEEFDSEWAESSLGFRQAGRRDTRGRSSSVSAMSPSMGSCMTLESEEDDLGGLVLPTEPIDFTSMLKKRKAVDYDVPAPAVQSLDQKLNDGRPGKSSKMAEEDDMMAGLDFGGDLLDTKKRKINRNIKISQPKPSTPVTRTGTTLTFTDKPVSSKIPRPTPPPVRTQKLDTVPESHHATPQSRLNRLNRPAAQTTTGPQLLRSKRSAPLLGAKPPPSARPPVPFLPAGVATAHSHHIKSKASSSHLRTPSDHYDRPQSPPPSRNTMRPGSSAQLQPNENTPSRTGFRRDGPSASLLRQVASHRSLSVTKRKTFGDGSELDRFDDLPTSTVKESKFVKEPVNRDRVAGGKTLRPSQSRRNLNQHHLTSITPPVPPSVSSASSTVPSTPLATGAPPTPKGYFPIDMTPRFARDTAASRNAREQRLNNTRPRGAGPVEAVAINWKAQIAARSPQTSPSAQRLKKRTEGKQPFLIKNMGGAATKHEKGMIYNPTLQRWEGNEHALTRFENPSTSTLPLHPTFKDDHTRHHHTNSIPSALTLNTNIGHGNNFQTITNAAAAATSALAPRDHNVIPPARHGSPPRPALISQINNVRGVVVERGMVFDPQRMTWLKLDSKWVQQHANDPATAGIDLTGGHGPGSVVSISVEEEEDVFAGLDDLVDERAKIVPGAGAANFGQDKENAVEQNENWAVGEEFDLGPAFVRRQKAEEQEWRRKVDRWMLGREQENDQGWRWEIRRVAERYDMRI